MTIDTKEEASTLWRTKAVVVAIFSVLIIVIVFFIPLGSVIRSIICGALSLIFLFFYWYQYKMEYTYFYFSNATQNLVFKFYSLRNFYGRPKTIEISKMSFSKYEFITGFFNKKESLVLYQRTPKGVAKYPPISLTLLKKSQRTELKRALHAAANDKN